MERKLITECTPGDVIDMGVFDGIDPRATGQGPNTVNVRLANGHHYTETAGALVRVWGREGQVHRVRVPATFFDDADSRGLAVGWVVRRLARQVDIDAYTSELVELRDDACHYAAPLTRRDLGADYRGLCDSAAATVRAIDKAAN